MVQEYERAVIFRLGRLLSGGSRGPGKCYQPLFRSTQVHILKTGCLLLPLILLKEILGGKKTFLLCKKGWRATTIALRFSSFQVLSSYFRASRITQRSTFAPRLLTFPRRRFVLDLLYNSLMQQNSGYISRLLCSSEINSSTRTTLTRKTYEYMADSLLVWVISRDDWLHWQWQSWQGDNGDNDNRDRLPFLTSSASLAHWQLTLTLTTLLNVS